MIAIADCNSFYASCEKLFRPDLIGKPVVVLSNNDGCIVSRTDEAKKLGIDMAVPYFQCKNVMLQHGVTTFSSNYHLYGDMSQRVMNTFRNIMGDEMIEVYSVDEAFINFKHVPDKDIYNTALQLKSITEQNTEIPICVCVALIDQSPKDLSSEFPALKGFSRTNLFYTKRCYLFYKDTFEKMPQLVAQLASSKH